MPDDTENWQRIARYALGECTAEEAVQTRAWIEADPERRSLAEELIRLADAGPTAVWDARKAWDHFSATLDTAPLPQYVARSSAARRRSAQRWGAPRMLVAAAAAIVLLVSSAVVWQSTTEPTQVTVASEDLRTITTQRRQTAEIYLSDGTRVVLGAASTLRFPERFRGGRDVFLEGEAYFDVAPEQRRLLRRNRQFAVHTERAVARDIGTSFSVRAYKGSSSTDVVVAEGAVALAPASSSVPPRAVADSLLLTAGDLGRLDENGAITVLRGVDVAAYHGWMEGRLVFTDAPISEVIAKFRHWYDVDLQVGDATLASARVTATFDTRASAAALDLMAAVLDVRIVRNGNTVVLHRKPRGR